MENADIVLYNLLGLTVVGLICWFMWPRRKPKPHFFGAKVMIEAEQYRKDLEKKKAEVDFQNSVRREIKRANRVRPKPPVLSTAPVRNRDVDRTSSDDGFLTGVLVGAAINSALSSSSRNDDASSSSGSFTGGGGDFGGGGASGSWDSGSSSDSYSSSSSDSGSSSSGSD